MSEALRLGIRRKTLYAMRDAGVLETVTRGLYRLASLDPLAHPDLVTVATVVPQGVLCLISALSFHELTTQIPHTIDMALERGARDNVTVIVVKCMAEEPAMAAPVSGDTA